MTTRVSYADTYPGTTQVSIERDAGDGEGFVRRLRLTDGEAQDLTRQLIEFLGEQRFRDIYDRYIEETLRAHGVYR